MSKKEAIEPESEKKTKTRKRRVKEPPTFVDTLDKMLSCTVQAELLPESIKSSLPRNSTYLDAVLMAMIIKAMGGDTQASVYLRDTSGNKLKDGAKEKRAKKRFEDF